VNRRRESEARVVAGDLGRDVIRGSSEDYARVVRINGYSHSLRHGYRCRNWKEVARVICLNFVCTHTRDRPAA